MKRFFTYIILFFIPFAIGFFVSHSANRKMYQNQMQIIDTLIITKVDTFRQKVYTPRTYSVIRTDTVKIYDTIRAIQDFASIHIYDDTLYIDSVCKIFLLDTLQFNRIRSRSFQSVYKTTEKTIFVNQSPKSHISAGVGVAYSGEVSPFVAVNYSRNRNTFSVQAGKNYCSASYAYQLW